MTSDDVDGLDPVRIRQLFDLRSSENEYSGGGYREDPYPAFHRLRETGPVHEGTVHELIGYGGPAYFYGLPEADRPHYSAFSYETCDRAFRDAEIFASSPEPLTREARGKSIGIEVSLLAMEGKEHRRFRGLVQPSFVPSKARWWIERWIESTVYGLIDNFVDKGRAELNTDFCAAIPLLTITGSFGVSVEDALDLRAALRVRDANRPNMDILLGILEPVVAARREDPKDDLISVLVEAELTDEDGVTHRLSDEEIYSFSYLLLAAGSGTTWKQMGITLAALLRQPALLEAVREDRSLLRPAIEEALRWNPTDPMFSRWVRHDVELGGVQIPAGSVLHLCVGAANRDPERWERPDEYDPNRKSKPSLGFGSGPHTCMGMHVARAEMQVGIGALLDRLPGLRLDPGSEPPQIMGLYERGATEIPVVFG